MKLLLLYLPQNSNISNVSLCFLSREVNKAIDLASNLHPDSSHQQWCFKWQWERMKGVCVHTKYNNSLEMICTWLCFLQLIVELIWWQIPKCTLHDDISTTNKNETKDNHNKTKWHHQRPHVQLQWWTSLPFNRYWYFHPFINQQGLCFISFLSSFFVCLLFLDIFVS